MPIKIVAADKPKRKAKRGQSKGAGDSSWKRPYKDYTKIKHTNLIQTLDGRKKGQIQESGPPGTEKKLHDKSMKRLNELQKLKSREGTRMTSGAQKKRKEHLQRGGYKAGSSVGKTKGPKGIGKGQTIRDRLKEASKRDGRKSFFEQAGGREQAKPHSTKEGRTAAGQRRVGRILEQLKPKTMEQRPLPRYTPKKPGWPKRKPMQPLRAKHGIGNIVKKGISKILKPKGVFKPKPVPKTVTDKPTGWSPKGEYTKADDNKINSMLKKLGDEIKAQPLPPKTKELVKKLQKAYGPHKKAEGGRIG